MAFTRVDTLSVGNLKCQTFTYDGSGGTTAQDIGARRVVAVTVNESAGGGAVGTEIARISGVYAVVSGLTSGTNYKVAVFYV